MDVSKNERLKDMPFFLPDFYKHCVWREDLKFAKI